METVLESFSPRPGPLDSLHRQFMGILKFHRVDGERKRAKVTTTATANGRTRARAKTKVTAIAKVKEKLVKVGRVPIKATSLKAAEPFVLRSTAALAIWYVGP
jgi:hypothetical protein